MSNLPASTRPRATPAEIQDRQSLNLADLARFVAVLEASPAARLIDPSGFATRTIAYDRDHMVVTSAKRSPRTKRVALRRRSVLALAEAGYRCERFEVSRG